MEDILDVVTSMWLAFSTLPPILPENHPQAIIRSWGGYCNLNKKYAFFLEGFHCRAKLLGRVMKVIRCTFICGCIVVKVLHF